MWVLSGLAVMVFGFVLRFNPLVVILAAALASGLSAGLQLVEIVAAFGKAFNNTRYVSVIWIVLPVIGLLERRGLQERAKALISGLKGATTGRLLLGYLLFRQLTSALGLTSIAGPAQTVRPLVAPMAVAASGSDDPAEQNRIKALSAATDNVGLFFGEDIFIAIGSILLMKGFMDQQGIQLSPFDLSVWAIPTAIFAFAIHGFRLWRLDRKEAGQ
ncbi:DUF969 domain-containing protein [Novosphingobium sp. B 225]|uniref:DUF969 domain-containing protein n=1 Tax=Novosphingobium sp. B 225 TaxID=1961849 RepID=UPI000B4BDCC1|nr:DUF969 domain-containing protein [Novosphingobium sp. B 225]